MPKFDFNRHLHALTRDLPATHGRRLRRNLLFTGLTLTIIGCLTLIARAHAAVDAYVVDDLGAEQHVGDDAAAPVQAVAITGNTGTVHSYR